MKKNKRRADWRNSMQYRLSIRFILLLTCSILVLSLSIVGIALTELYESTREQGALFVDTMEKAETNSQEEWLDFLETYTSGENSPYYARIVLESGEVIYSYSARELFSDFSQFRQLLFFSDILWTDDFEPYYYVSVDKGGNKAAVLIEMEDKLDLVEGIVSLTFVLTLLIVIIGSVITYRFARNFSQPLTRMNHEISSLRLDEQQSGELTVPDSPQEVKTVSESFNQLLDQQRKSLEREKQFVADASHELRTPLAAIRGHVNLINRRGEQHPEVIPKSISFIDRESKRMEEMVKQLLTLGRTTGERKEIDLSQLIFQTVEELQVMMPQQLIMEIEKQVVVFGNHEHFYQIVRNLIENAVKYTEADGTITLRLKQSEDQIYFEVADTGIGIADPEKQQIFERFYRADQSRSSKIAGSGIGLSIVRELTLFYGGTICVEDNQPKGSRFILSIPKRLLDK
ncbi:HAMP domain-containing histidine kinase [Enterococcus sp. BWM-S5]|uniref:histidine kinase n=1 Tax=Enterococcus larvae TaxID=2794352 RepID=A0ABS4CRH4_9ENTE|nr:HAMP domain-containing sensor histidine kinase [Enterococcus larvae]MBP1048384.1 HAMP domain-containing histidine kinase [Enterococcus larvae]